MKITPPNPALMAPEGGKGLENKAPKEDFGNLLNKMVDGVNQMQQEGDRKISGSLMGTEDLHEAMLSLEKANIGIKLLLQVRNKMVKAYEELSRMPL